MADLRCERRSVRRVRSSPCLHRLRRRTRLSVVMLTCALHGPVQRQPRRNPEAMLGRCLSDRRPSARNWPTWRLRLPERMACPRMHGHPVR
jgi:hypothetical protein